MTIHDYIRELIAAGLEIRGVRLTSFYQAAGSGFEVDGVTIAVQLVTHDDATLCEFLDASGGVIARAKGFDSLA